MSSRPLVSESLVVVDGRRQARVAAGRWTPAIRGDRWRYRSPRSVSSTCIVKATSRSCSRRTKRTRSGSSASRTERLTSRTASTTTSCKGQADAVNPAKQGTKAAPHYRRDGWPARPSLRFASGSPMSKPANLSRALWRGWPLRRPFRRSPRGLACRRPTHSSRPSRHRLSTSTLANVMRQALAGMLWSKQFYLYDVDKWLEAAGQFLQADPESQRLGTITGITCTTVT